MRRLTPLFLALPLIAQGQSTFYGAYGDGLDAERRGDWRGALADYQRAAALRPASAKEVFTYGNNLMKGYFPYTRIARCHLELGELDAAQTQIAKARAMQEPSKEVDALARRLADLLASREAKAAPPPQPPPSPVQQAPAPPPQEKPEPLKPVPQPEQTAPAPATAVQPAPATTPPRKPATTTTAASAPKTIETPAANPAAVAPQPSPAPPSAAAAGERPRPWWPWLLLAIPGAAVLFWRRRTPPANDMNEPGQIGPYRVERLLGRGGFASTYLARHGGSGKAVALKRLHPYRLEDPEFVGRFRQEARLGAQLSHPNLVALVDLSPPDGSPWIAMDFVEGESLGQRLKAVGRMPLDEALRIAKEIASGLSYAHSMGVVHRDLKPANIMLAATGAKITDFGIARVVDAETLTTTYAFLGTPRYAAPEAQLKTAIGPAADWYAFGIILFEMLAGAPPFTGETPFEILDRHRSEPLPDLRALRSDAPEPLVELVEALCAKQPQDRPSEAEILKRLGSIEGA